MNKYLQIDEWKIVEKGFNPENHEASESIFSLGNGKIGQRGNFEEKYSGESLQGNYVAGVYYPDKTRVGWWKNGYPEYFAKVLNAPNWIGINITIDNEEVDLEKCTVDNFERVLNMYEGYLQRTFKLTLKSGKQIEIKTQRFLSVADSRICAIQYSVKSVNFDGNITFEPYLDADVHNRDANYNEQFWKTIDRNSTKNIANITAETLKTGYQVTCSMMHEIAVNGNRLNVDVEQISGDKYVSNKISIHIKRNQQIDFYKYVAVTSSLDYDADEIVEAANGAVKKAIDKGYNYLFMTHKKIWAEKWEESDIKIEGDAEAQQGIRFNIFQLYQTYTGEDERLNIGPKGFTGEKYGGSTYWDTEAYCFPFYMATSESEIARNLLIYRHKHLTKAIENAEKLGFKNGAALYPMVTMNGEECHNEWEITFEEIHRNGAIAFAIYNYERYTGDKKYLAEYGLEVLIAISRFWSQRVNFSNKMGKFVMLGVTGPNEYENNVNNNWYTNTIAKWTMQYTIDSMEYVKQNHPVEYKEIITKTKFDQISETSSWKNIIDNMHFPVDTKRNIFLQQDGFLDKKIEPASEIPANERPINQNWSWDRILRSCYIKQADVLQGLYFLEEMFDKETIRRNFDFYEPITVHESSLSPCVHSILASKLGRVDKAYELYLRTSRLDLDDYNNEVAEGLHITSMAGTWLSIVEGFGGMRVRDGKLHFEPHIPENWKSFSFKIRFRRRIIEVKISHESMIIQNHSDKALEININQNNYLIDKNAYRIIDFIQEELICY